MSRSAKKPEATPRERSADGFALPPGWALACLGLAIVAGGLLRFRDLGVPSLWTDELVSWWAATAGGTGDVLSRVKSCMATPPLSSLVQHASMGLFGTGEWALRLPSAVAGVMTIPVVFLAGYRMFGAAAGSVAALFLAFHPFHLWWSTDGRPYGLAVLLAAGSVWAFSEMVRKGSPGSLVAWALASAGLLYAQFIFLPLPATQALLYVLLWRTGRAAALPPPRAAAAAAVAGLLCLPLLPQMLSVGRRAPGLTWPASVGNYPPGIYGLLQTTALVTAALLFLAYVSFRRGGVVTEVADAADVADVAARPGADTGSEGASSDTREVLQVTVSFLLPLLTLGALALIADLPTLIKPRYGAAYVVPAVLLVGWLTTRSARLGGRLLFAGSFLVLLLSTAVIPPLKRGDSFNENAKVEDWRAAVALLESERRPGDLVLLRSGLIETEAIYAGSFPEECLDYVAAPLPGPYVDGDLEVLLLPMEFAETPPPEYARRFGDRLVGQPRVWVVMAHPEDPGTYYGRVEAYVRQAAGLPLQLARAGSFGPVTVALLAAPGAPG